MIKHFIILSSSYIDGQRIALDFIIDDSTGYERAKSAIEIIRERTGGEIPLSTHYIEVKNDTWEAVQEYDAFFSAVKKESSIDAFIDTINKSRLLKGIDVANYILTVIKCSHTKLEKLVYLAYADYLCAFKEKLFEDKIYAFQYGPVIDSVFETFKDCGYVELENNEDERFVSSVSRMPAKSRILFAKNGKNKLIAIDRVIERYKDYSASQLVNLTHKKNSPWENCYDGGFRTQISDEAILKYHQCEV